MAAAVNIFWFRRDLRLNDNAGLFHALRSGLPVLPVFIFDRNILDELEDRKDRRVEFIYTALQDLQKQLLHQGSAFDIRYGRPAEIFRQLIKDYTVQNVYTNSDYEPYAITRDTEIAALLKENNIGFHSYKDHVIFEKDEVTRDDGQPYTVFTPYSRKWKSGLEEKSFKQYPSARLLHQFYKQSSLPIPSLQSMGFEACGIPFPPRRVSKNIFKEYNRQRDYPAMHGTSRLSVPLRFGTITIRDLADRGGQLNHSFLNELIWRDFYQMILWHHPKVVTQSFKPAFDKIVWRNNEIEFEAWCQGQTGYPIVDAGMRELNETGYMHNRVRMITASFLVKHLLIDWRWGEAYFAKKLLDYDLAANNGGWQWAAGSGTDAAPYFRIFSPYLQTKKFDPSFTYIRKWVPEFEELNYAAPIVEHEFARKRCLQVFAAALKGN